MNIYSRKGDGIICPDLHIAETEPRGAVQVAICLLTKTQRLDERTYMSPTDAIAMAQAILKHFNVTQE